MNGDDAPNGRPLRWFEYAVVLLPFALAWKGAMGLVIGPAACALTLLIMCSDRRRPAKLVATAGFAILLAFLWALATFLRTR